MNIWIIYPYGDIPGEGLRMGRTQMMAEALVPAGHPPHFLRSTQHI